jgi:hypothetical protein
MDECLAYFRQAVADPLSVPPWSEWWATHGALVERVFPRLEYVRLKHRKLRGARQILQNAGELPDNYDPSYSLQRGSCSECGERTNCKSGAGGGIITCPNCGLICVYDCHPDVT